MCIRDRAKEDAIDIRDIDNNAVRDSQIARLKQVRAARDTDKVNAALADLARCAETGEGNLLEFAVNAMRLRASVGEVSDAMEKTFGRFRATQQTVSGVYGAVLEGMASWESLKAEIAKFNDDEGRRPRIMIAKLGQDGHDRGAKVVARCV